jgi:hypothetical protein
MRINDAILALNPNITVIRGDVAYDKDGNEVAYDKAAVEAYAQSQAYKVQRAAAYPSFADQFDLLYHGGIDAWKEAIDAVKTEFPKP